jgi:putative membrane protein
MVPTSQATLTAFSSSFIVASGVALLVGWYFVRHRRVTAHKRSMLTATAFAGLFLVAYVTRWAIYGSKPFEGTGPWRAVYLGILVPHVLLAIAVGPLALYLIHLALNRRDFATHRRVARVTLPLWLFVSASGWAIYWLLYRMF